MPLLARDQSFLMLRPADAADIPVLRELAELTWRESYAAILSPEQMDYMLVWMYSPETIARELAEGVVWEIVAIEDAAIGFLSCTYDSAERRLKLNKLYLLPERQGAGLGQVMLARVLTLAAALGAREISLQVNKRNARAIAAYERAGYRIERAAVFAIGGGFVMDDYVMSRPVGA